MGAFWFENPAEKWEEALPIGNGRLGAMIFGGIQKERIALNQDSMWYGGPVDRINPEARGHLKEVRTLLLDGKIPEAEELLRLAFSGTPQSQRPYQPLGDLEIVYQESGVDKSPCDGHGRSIGADGSSDGEEYRRELDMENGLVIEQYRSAERVVRKEYLSSYPHGVIAVRIQALEGSISLQMLLTRKRFYDHAGKLDENTIYMDGMLGENGVAWMAALRASVQGGEACVIGEHLVVKDAREVILYLGCETSFYENDYREVLRRKLDIAGRDGYERIRRQHVEDYRKLYGSMDLQIGAHPDVRSMEQQFSDGMAGGFSGSFAALYFQYGRYLMISSSRPGSLPATLQGIWNEDMEPAWDSKFTININTEMNYWPAEMCGLSECHLPLFDHLKRMWESGRRTASEMYGCRGFVAHHNTDIWGDCAPQDIYIPATYWVMGAAWLCTHIWNHYSYTQDERFLKELYPILEDAVLFFHDFLIEVNGRLLTCPSVSPENTYILPSGVRGCLGLGSTMDNEILRDLFEIYLKASDALHMEKETVETTRQILAKLLPIQIGKHGQIMEWREDYEELEPGHRHISQLYALHPSHQITKDKTPELAEAARKTLERRLKYGGGYTGWSCAWIINFYARLGDGESALENLGKLWRNSTFPNLMDNHPRRAGHVFQIDGNFGATAAIAEMLVQSNEDRVLLLPALPRQWEDGNVTGLKVVGGAALDLKWREGVLTECIVHASSKALSLKFRYGDDERICALEAGESVKIYSREQ